MYTAHYTFLARFQPNREPCQGRLIIRPNVLHVCWTEIFRANECGSSSEVSNYPERAVLILYEIADSAV